MSPPVSVAVLVASHNRKAKTLACFDSLMRQDAAAILKIVLFDDCSTDGTVEAVKMRHPAVEILSGNGQAFWSGGMRAAFDFALESDADFYLWLNDDVDLAPQALRHLLTTHAALAEAGHGLCLVGGAVADPRSGGTSYGGIIRPYPRRPLRFQRCSPHPHGPLSCDTLLGNVVLVPRVTAQKVGSIGQPFRHSLGDLDYGLRVRAAGGWVGLASGHVGWCAPNETASRWFNPDLSLSARWRLLNQPLGFPLGPWLHFARRHGGVFWPLFAPLPFWRLLMPRRLAKVIDRWRSPKHGSNQGAAYARVG